MAKILLVEDDNNLREIYEARLQAEGYEIVTAKDGEEALVVAKKEQPDLIIADVMMPRVSGYEMLDILRNTEGLKDVHVIMLTALGQAEDKTRADSLGADRYLVKSQVTLEDIVKTAADVLAGTPANAAAQAAAVAEPPAATAQTPATPTATAPQVSIPVTAPPAEPPTNTQPASVTSQANPDPQPQPKITIPVSEPPTTTAAPPTTPAPPSPGAAASDDKLMADAMKDLIANTTTNNQLAATPAPATPAPSQAPGPAEPTVVSAGQPTASPAPTVVNPTPMPPDVTPPSAPTTPPLTPQTAAPAAGASTTPTQTDNDAVSIANKKVITPLNPATAAAPPDLNALLAKEGITQMDDTAHPATGFLNPNGADHPHTPGHVISPAANNTPGISNPSDPSSISL